MTIFFVSECLITTNCLNTTNYRVTDRPNPELQQSVTEIVDNPAEITITPNLNTGTVDNVNARAITPGSSIEHTMPSRNSFAVNNNANDPVASTYTT